ncbi:MAG: hypothetical protein ACLRFE_03285 [Clostridia bacterium]
MRQDRKLNKVIMFSSIIGILIGIVLLLGGIGAGVFGYLKPNEFLKIDEIVYFINQQGIVGIQKELLNGKLLDYKFLFVVLGSIIAVVGLITFILALVTIKLVKKQKVANRKVVLIFFAIIHLAIASCAGTYLYLEFKNLPNIIKYVMYGVAGVYGFIALLNIFGLIINRSEQFMSNDNRKYAFDNSAMRSARVEVNNNVRDAQYQPNIMPNQAQQNPYANNQARPNPQPRPMPQGQRPPMQNTQQNRPVAHPTHALRPQIDARAQSTARPVASGASRPMQRPTQPVQRPMQSTRPIQQPMRPAQPAQRPVSMQPKKYCLMCGSEVKPGNNVCPVCGTDVE